MVLLILSNKAFSFHKIKLSKAIFKKFSKKNLKLINNTKVQFPNFYSFQSFLEKMLFAMFLFLNLKANPKCRSYMYDCTYNILIPFVLLFAVYTAQAQRPQVAYIIHLNHFWDADRFSVAQLFCMNKVLMIVHVLSFFCTYSVIL